MKALKITLLLSLATLALVSCKEELKADLFSVNIQLEYPDDFFTTDSVKVYVGGYMSYTNGTGLATFTVPAGSYTVTASESRSINGSSFNFNASSTISVAANISDMLNMTMSESSQLIIKEVYTGGCPLDDGSGTFSKDAYIIIYNNSDLEAVVDTNFCIAFAFPYNSNATNNYLDGDGNLTHDTWIPASTSLWHFQNKVIIKPWEQILMPVYQAIDQTGTYSNSVDLSNAAYFPLYDPNDFGLESYYVSPSEKIPTSNYLNAIKYGLGSAWGLSKSSPALFLFATEDIGPAAFAADASRTEYYGGSTNQVSQKVPIEWVIDAVDIFRQGYDEKNTKRFPDNVDAGKVTFSNGYGYTVYRNVDKNATEAMADNDGLIVYNYTGGTEGLVDGSTDDSGIDAEASITKGAKVVYKNTNNSSNDFHQRVSASIK